MIESAKTRYGTFNFYSTDTIIGQAIKLYGEYTQIELELLKIFCNVEHTIIYDVGANIGYHSVGFASYAKHVYCFEPNLKNYKILELNTKSLNNVTLIQSGCSDKNTLGFVTDFDINKPGNYGECMLTNAGQSCNLIKLDDANLPIPHIIKIDVEGHELAVINGARNIITTHKPVIFYESMHGSGFDIIYDYLHDQLGYSIHWMFSGNYNPNNYNNNVINIFGSGGVINCLATPPGIKVEGLVPMISRNDTYTDFIQRLLKERQAK